MTDPGPDEARRPRFLHTNPWLAGADDADPDRAAAKRLAPGTALEGGYRILSVLAAGGMGVVYEAAQTGSGTKVAIKVLQPVAAEARAMAARFRAEARMSATLRHPNLVAVISTGIAPGGRPFLVMPLLEGESLAAVLASRGPLSAAEGTRILDQILCGLAAIHQRGIVHRDLKPENVFLARDGERETARIIDFGVARFPGAPTSEVTLCPALDSPDRSPDQSPSPRRLTRDGMVMGTPGYLAPETASASPAVDRRSDLFSAAVLAYEMLIGRLPFCGTSAREVLIATVEHPVPRPRALRPDIEPAMERLLLTGLAKRPEDRFQTAAEFRRHLAAAIAGHVPRDARPCVTETSEP